MLLWYHDAGPALRKGEKMCVCVFVCGQDDGQHGLPVFVLQQPLSKPTAYNQPEFIQAELQL